MVAICLPSIVARKTAVTSKYIRAKAIVRKDVNDQPHLMIGTNWDVTDVKEREKELQNLSEVKDKFIATMSHEVRTPLNGILGMAEILALEIEDVEHQACLDSLVQSAKHLNTLITDILDFSKMKSGKLSLVARPFDLHHMLKSSVQLYTPRLAPGCRLSLLELDAIPRYFIGDQTRIRQLLNNLLSNAVKFTHQGVVTLEVIAESTGAHTNVTVRVADSGIGIPEDKQSLLFDDFFQADSSRSRQYGGTGLGLAISRRIIDMMGGEIGFESSEDTGSTFWFSVPLQVAAGGVPQSSARLAASKPNAARAAVVTDEPLGQGLTVQIMEDNPVNMKITKRLVEKLGFSVVSSFWSDRKFLCHSLWETGLQLE
jgi:signal transduction histidine kinase